MLAGRPSGPAISADVFCCWNNARCLSASVRVRLIRRIIHITGPPNVKRQLALLVPSAKCPVPSAHYPLPTAHCPVCWSAPAARAPSCSTESPSSHPQPGHSRNPPLGASKPRLQQTTPHASFASHLPSSSLTSPYLTSSLSPTPKRPSLTITFVILLSRGPLGLDVGAWPPCSTSLACSCRELTT